MCGGGKWEPIFSLGKTPLANSFVRPGGRQEEPFFELGIQFCPTCGLVSLTHTVDKEVLYKHYIYISSDSHTISSHLAGLSRKIIERYNLRPKDLVGEIGSNTGTFLKLFWNHGFQVLGIEPAENIAAVANANGVRTVSEFYDARSAKKLREEFGPLKILAGRHVFAHIDRVADALEGVADHLRPDGVFIVEVPYLLDLIHQNQFDTIYHEHLSYFSVRTLEYLFTKNALELIDVERYPVHGGSIVVYAQRKDGPYRRTAHVDDLLALEKREGLDRIDAYRAFAQRVERLRDQLARLVRDIKKQGKTIAGYGAPAKATTLLHYCGLTAREIDFAIDTTPAKQGLLMPGNHIPVRADVLEPGERPDYFLLFAWNYAKEITGKEAAFIKAGGRFIVPIPEPRVVERIND